MLNHGRTLTNGLSPAGLQGTLVLDIRYSKTINRLTDADDLQDKPKAENV